MTTDLKSKKVITAALTGAILLFCTLAALRVQTRGGERSATTLLLDNPIGRASRIRFLELQREVAKAMRV